MNDSSEIRLTIVLCVIAMCVTTIICTLINFDHQNKILFLTNGYEQSYVPTSMGMVWRKKP